MNLKFLSILPTDAKEKTKEISQVVEAEAFKQHISLTSNTFKHQILLYFCKLEDSKAKNYNISLQIRGMSSIGLEPNLKQQRQF